MSVLTLRRQPSNREGLKAALAKKAEAQAEVGEKHATYERVAGIVDQADRASRIAADAARDAKTFRAAWARNGCKYSETIELQALETDAAESAKAAETAALHADAVRGELKRAQEAVASAQVSIGHAEDEITGAIGLILADEASPLLAKFEQCAEQYRKLRAECLGVLRVLEQPWSLSNKNKMNPAHEGEAVIEAALQRGKIKTFDDEGEEPRARDYLNQTSHHQDWLASLSAPWRARAVQLRADPEC